MISLIEYYNLCPKNRIEFVYRIANSYSLINSDSLNEVILFGTEKLGLFLVNRLKEFGKKVIVFSDNNPLKWGKSICGIPIISPKELIDFKKCKVIIASKYVKDIMAQLHSLGFKYVIPHYVLNILFPEIFPNDMHQSAIDYIINDRKVIERCYKSLYDDKSKEVFLQLLNFRVSLQPQDLPSKENNQYFPEFFWIPSKDECYIDVGAYNGDTYITFLEKSSRSFYRYYALEPDKINFEKLKKRVSSEFKDKVFLLCLGAGSKKTSVSFNSTGFDDASIRSDGNDVIQIIPLDELCQNEKVTTIKIDVEGYEPEVIYGAAHIIQILKPKLAVCVYHRPWHLWSIMMQIHNLRSDYRFYLRHHEEEIYETVLYAI